jgi:acetyltransferase-like isoleucine patch superfamily enzyme
MIRHRIASDVAVSVLRAQGIEMGAGVRLLGWPIITRAESSRIQIGARSRLVSRSDRTALGVNHPVVLRTLLPGALIEIGDNVGISGGSICAAVHVTIGNGTMLGANVVVADTDFHPLDSRERWSEGVPAPAAEHAVVIGRNVFVGTGAIILKGALIGDDTVIGAGSVVSGSIPPGVVAAGNPARVLRSLSRHSSP